MSDEKRNSTNDLKVRAEAGEAAAQLQLARQFSDGGVPDLVSAARWFRRAAEQGNSEAQYCLAVRHLNGQGVDQDLSEAVKWLRKAADQGHAGAQDSLGVRYATGQGVPQNEAEALKWFRRAAEQGHAVAQFNLGLAYAQGKGAAIDLVEAYAWFCLSAEMGDAVAAGAVETVVESLTLDELRQARALFHQLYSSFANTSQKRAA